MLIRTCMSLALLFASTQAYPDEPGSCNSPQPFGRAHLGRSPDDYVGGTDLTSFGLQVFIGGTQLAEGETFDVKLNQELDIELRATNTARKFFRGFLIKLVHDEFDTTDMLISTDATIRDDLADCVDLASGSLSHTNNNGKESITGTIFIASDIDLSGFKLEVTVAVENDDISQWYQSAFDVTASAVPDAPVAPSDAPVAPTDAPVAPSDAPVAPSDAPVAPTDAPVAPTDAPVAPSDAPVAPSDAPVAPSDAPVAPSDAPVAPTDAPVAVSDAPVAPSDAPVAPSDAPVAPSGAPVAISTTNPPVSSGSYDSWFTFLEDLFVGTNLKRCYKRQGNPPTGGKKCSSFPKTCYFGTQDCATVGAYPTSRCFCDGSTWSCDATTCPATVGEPVP